MPNKEHQPIEPPDESREGVERIEFSVRGVTYEIVLSEADVVLFDTALKPYIGAATKLSSSRRQPRTSTRIGPAPSKQQLDAIRGWARKNGYDVSSRGRIQARVLAAYEARH